MIKQVSDQIFPALTADVLKAVERAIYEAQNVLMQDTRDFIRMELHNLPLVPNKVEIKITDFLMNRVVSKIARNVTGTVQQKLLPAVNNMMQGIKVGLDGIDKNLDNAIHQFNNDLRNFAHLPDISLLDSKKKAQKAKKNGGASSGVKRPYIKHRWTASILSSEMILMLITLILAALGATTGTKISSTCVIGKFCIFTEPDGRGNALITMHSYLGGWVAMGTGVHSGDHMIVAWKNSTGGYTISDRKADGENLPPASPNMISGQIPTRGQIPSWAKLSVSVITPLKSEEIEYTPDTEFVWAVGKKIAYSLDDQYSSFPIHEDFGHLGNLDLTAQHSLIGTVPDGEMSVLEIPDNMDYVTIVRIHGFFMIYAWLACPLVGIYIARYLKDRLGHYWFIFHVTVMVVGTGLGSIAGIMMIYLYKAGGHFLFVPSAHPFLGLLVTILLIVQFCLGVASDRLFSMDRKSIPWWDKCHWYLGRALTITAVVAIITGIMYTRYFNAFTILLPSTAAVILITGIGSFVFAEYSIGQVHHMDKSEKIDDIENANKTEYRRSRRSYRRSYRRESRTRW